VFPTDIVSLSSDPNSAFGIETNVVLYGKEVHDSQKPREVLPFVDCGSRQWHGAIQRMAAELKVQIA
jgi:hypothetical protein